MGSGQFNFGINNIKSNKIANVQVNNSQIEIDAAFEGVESLTIIEAKRDLSSDFLIRQLYYPFRVWKDRVSKKVRPVFLVYSNSVFYLSEYEFQNIEMYNSLVLIKQKNYSIEDLTIIMSDLLNIAKNIDKFVDEPPISFPQSDSFERVINICELLESQELSRNEATEMYAFDDRQTNYYTDAARYLGFVEKQLNERHPVYRLNKLGSKIFKMNYKQRQLCICKCILEHKVFFDTFALCKKGRIPDIATIVQLMKSAGIYNVNSESTFRRRASTIS